MVKIIELKDGSRIFKYGFHELAWSRRTSNMPLLAIYSSNYQYILKYIGGTTKAPNSIQIPNLENAEFFGILHVYWSNSGYAKFTLYTKDLSVSIFETENFRIPEEVPAHIRAFLQKVVEAYLTNKGFENFLQSVESPWISPVDKPKLQFVIPMEEPE